MVWEAPQTRSKTLETRIFAYAVLQLTTVPFQTRAYSSKNLAMGGVQPHDQERKVTRALRWVFACEHYHSVAIGL